MSPKGKSRGTVGGRGVGYHGYQISRMLMLVLVGALSAVRFGSELFSVMSSELGIPRDSGGGECNAARPRTADAVHRMGSLGIQTAEGWSHPRLFCVGVHIYHPIDCARAGRGRVIRPVLRTRHCAGGSSGNGRRRARTVHPQGRGRAEGCGEHFAL